MRNVRRWKEIQRERKEEHEIRKIHFEIGERGEDSGKVEDE
jgi:hypothetical protein